MGQVKGGKALHRAPLPTIMEEHEIVSGRAIPPRFAEKLKMTTNTDYNFREHCRLCGFWKSVFESVWENATNIELVRDVDVCRYKPGELVRLDDDCHDVIIQGVQEAFREDEPGVRN